MNIHNQKIIISRDVIFNENFHYHKSVDTNEKEEDLIDSHLFTFHSITSTNPQSNTSSSLPNILPQPHTTNQQEQPLPTQQPQIRSPNMTSQQNPLLPMIF
jgi:hypothetical protein